MYLLALPDELFVLNLNNNYLKNIMQTVIPKTSAALTSLLQADLKTQWRNRRSVVLLLLVPVLILISWKGLIAKVGGGFVLSTCVSLGLISIGLMGYTNSIARDRDKGVFQRLR